MSRRSGILCSWESSQVALAGLVKYRLGAAQRSSLNLVAVGHGLRGLRSWVTLDVVSM
jgi:hypothetical protein